MASIIERSLAAGEGFQIGPDGEMEEREVGAWLIRTTSLNTMLGAVWEDHGLDALVDLGIDPVAAADLHHGQVTKRKPFGAFLRTLDEVIAERASGHDSPMRQGSSAHLSAVSMTSSSNPSSKGRGELRKPLSRGTPPSKRGPHHGHGSSLLVAIADRSGISSPRLGSEGRVGSPRWRTCNHVARRSSKRRTLPLLKLNGWSNLNRCAWSVVRPRRFRRFEPHSSAREMSDHRSSTSSIPTLIRTNPGESPMRFVRPQG